MDRKKGKFHRNTGGKLRKRGSKKRSKNQPKMPKKSDNKWALLYPAIPRHKCHPDTIRGKAIRKVDGPVGAHGRRAGTIGGDVAVRPLGLDGRLCPTLGATSSCFLVSFGRRGALDVLEPPSSGVFGRRLNN